MKNMRIFDPSGIRPAEYRSHYPELKRIQEFDDLSATELICIWYYANPTSDIIGIENDMERIAKALELSNLTPQKAIREDVLKLAFPEIWAIAIERMRNMEPDARMKARAMIITIINNYENLCDPSSYMVDEKGEDGKTVSVVDTVKYVNATTKIAQELPNMIAKLEEGFGVSSRTGDEDEHGTGFDIGWHKEQSEK